LCKEDFFSGRLDYSPEPTPTSTCTPYSGGDTNDIATMEITGRPMTEKRMKALDASTLSGVKLTYENGAICPESGKQMKFSLNMYCNPDMAMDEYDFSLGALGHICEPHIDTVSKVACSRLSVSQLWEYISEYSEYFGVFLLIAGTLLVFAGRSLLKPAICFTGFLSTIAVSCLIFYSVYL